MRFAVWLAGLGVLASGAGCSSSTQPNEPELVGMTGAWIGLAPVLAPADSLGIFITDSAGAVTVFGRFNSGLFQQYTFAFTPSSAAGLKVALSSFSPPFFANLDVRLEGSTLIGTYNDAPVTLTRMHPPAVPLGLWVRTSSTGPAGPGLPRTDSIWMHRDGRIHRRLDVPIDANDTCINNGQGISQARPGAVVLIYLWSILEDGCNLQARDSLIIQGATLRRRTVGILGVFEEVYQHRAQ